MRRLRERSHTHYADYAETLPLWFDELRGNKGMRRRLTSPIDTEFQAGRWELTAGRLFRPTGHHGGRCSKDTRLSSDPS